MFPGGGGSHPAAWRPGYQSGPDQERLGDDLDRLRLLADRDGEGGQADRAAPEPDDQRPEHRPVEAVQALLVDLVQFEGRAGEITGDHPIGTDLGVIADPPEQPVGDPRGSPAPASDLVGPVGTESHPEQVRRPPDDDLQFGRLIEVQVGGEAEPVPERRGQQPRLVVAPTSVNGAISRGMAVAPGPFPTTTSTRKSSMAR